MSIIATILATWAVATTPAAVVNLAPPDPAADQADEVAYDPKVLEACLNAGGTEADCSARAIEAAAQPAAAARTPAAGNVVVDPATGITYVVDPNTGAAVAVDPATGAPLGAGEITPEQANARIAAGDEPQGGTMEEAHPGMSKEEYIELLEQVLVAQKEKVEARLEEKIAAKQAAKMDTMSSVLGWVSLSGFLLLLLPLGLRKKYPGQEKLLFKYSAIAAGLCVVAMFLFSRVLLLLRVIQAALSSVTNPQVAVIDGAFQVLEDNAADIADFGPVLIEAPLAQVASGEQDNLPLAIIDNISRINEDITVFKTIARQFEGVFAMFGYLPIVLTIVAVVLFLLSLKPVITDIAAMPGKVASGEAKAGDVIKAVFRNIGRELLATLCLIGALIVVTIFSGIMLTQAVQPAVEAFLAYVFTSLIYTVVAPEFSKFVVYASVLGAILFLVLNIAVVLVTNVLFLGKLQKIFKRRFHDKVKLSAFKRFWGWGSLAFVWAQVLPIAFVAGAQEGVDKLLEKLMEGGGDPPWTAILLSGPAILVFGFLLVFWAARGMAAVKFILKYRPQDVQAVAVPGARGGTARYRSTAVG